MADSFGCRRCYGDDPDRAWSYYDDGLVVERELEADPHFIVQLRRCAECGQQFAWIFSETVDWDGGEDAQQRQIVPIDHAEADVLAERGSLLVDDRRHLETDWPTGAETQSVRWSSATLRLPSGRLR